MPLNETGGPRYGVEQHHEPVGGTLAPAQGLPTQSAVREEGRPGASTTEGVTGLRGGSDSLGETGRSIRGLKAEPAAAPAAVSLDAGGATASADALFIAAAEAAAKAAVETPGDPFHRSLSYPNFDRVKALYNHHAADRKVGSTETAWKGTRKGSHPSAALRCTSRSFSGPQCSRSLGLGAQGPAGSLQNRAVVHPLCR